MIDIFNLVGYLFETKKDSVEIYFKYFVLFYFMFTFFLALFCYKYNFFKKVVLYLSFIAGSVLFLGNIYPQLTFDKDNFKCGVMYGFFDSIHAYIVFLIIFTGVYISTFIKEKNQSSVFSTDLSLIKCFFNYLLSLFFGLSIYIPFTLYIILINIPINYISDVYISNKIIALYFKAIIIWLQFGIYTGWLLDVLIKKYKPSIIFKMSMCGSICIVSTINWLLYGIVYHVNEGTK